MLILYSQLFANGCNTSYVDATVQAEGIIKWQKTICGKSEEKAEARSLLSMDDLILAEGLQSIYAFTNEGKELWTRRKWYGTPVVFYKGLLYFTSAERKSRMEAVDLSNQIHIRDFWMPNVVEDSYLSLFEPLENGLIAQVKFTPGPAHHKEGSIIYKIQLGGLGFEWSQSFEGETRIIPVMCRERNILVTSVEHRALVFALENSEKEPDPKAEFELPYGEKTYWVSCSSDGSLYWLGMDDGQPALTVTDETGNVKWTWSPADSIHAGGSEPLMPALITPSGVFVVTRNSFYALINGSLDWSFAAVNHSLGPATALADGTVLLVEGDRLHRLDKKGKLLFELLFEEPLVTPPVIGGSGLIFVASKEKLFAVS